MADVIKKARRGVTNQTQATSQLRFHEKDASNNGLFVGHLAECKVDWSVNADGKQFTGMKVPRLTLHFASMHTNAAEQRHVYQTLFPVESSVDTIPGGKEEWKVNIVFNWIKHLLDVYVLKGRQLTTEEEAALELSFVDFDDNNEYVVTEPQDVIDGYATLFNNFVAMMEGKFGIKEGETPKCAYKDANGKPIPVWMKLLRHRKRKNEWVNVGQNGELGFDNFLTSSAIEIQRPNMPPAILRLDLAKESITPKVVNKTPTVGIPGVPGAAIVPPTAAGIPMDNTAYAEAAGDMPF